MSDPVRDGAAVADPEADPEVGAAPAGERGVRLPVAVLVVVATVVVALLAVWGTTAVDAARLPTGPAMDPPAAPPPATSPTTFTLDGRDASYEELKISLAGPPFDCGTATSTLPSAFDAMLVCKYVVHPRYDAAGHSWAALNGVVLLDDSAVSPDLPQTASVTFRALLDLTYEPGDHARVRKVSDEPVLTSLPAGRTASHQAEVAVRRKGLATPYDKVVVAVVALKSGRHVAFFSEFPHDGDKAALQAVAASAGSISVSG